jgi:hypothetical protein
MGVTAQRHSPAALYPTGKDPRTGGWVDLRAGLRTEVRGKILSPLPGIEPRSPRRPARCQTLYWLSYPAHSTLLTPEILRWTPTAKSWDQESVLSYTKTQMLLWILHVLYTDCHFRTVCCLLCIWEITHDIFSKDISCFKLCLVQTICVWHTVGCQILCREVWQPWVITNCLASN